MKCTQERLRSLQVLLAVPLLAGAGGLFLASNHAATAGHSAQSVPTAGPTQPYYASSQAETRKEGHKAFADRSPAVQAVMRKMYRNDGNYRTLSATFVDHVPGDLPGSIVFAIQQPATIHEFVYENLDASGSPVEEMMSSTGGNLFINHRANISAIFPIPQVLGPEDIAQNPLSVIPQVSGPTGLQSVIDPGTGAMTDDLVHPGGFINTPLFTNKDITIESESSYAGRPVWVLLGKQVLTAPLLPDYGDSWRMMVDKQTGIILQMLFYSGGNEIGWMGLQNVIINGQESKVKVNMLTRLPNLTGIQRVDARVYVQKAR